MGEAIKVLHQTCKYESTALLLGGAYNNLMSSREKLANLQARYTVKKDL